jgi:hypothetical protein
LAVLALLAAPGAGLAQDAPSAVPAAAAPPPTETVPQVPWVKRDRAELDALDKISARRTKLEVQVGQSVRYGSLTITVRACEVRPPDMAQDATAWVTISDSRPGAPAFQGWMLENEPALSVFEHPVYDVRLAGCR